MNGSVRVERGRDGRRFAVARDVDASADAAWRLLVDVERWPTWGPSVSAVRGTSGAITGGTTGEVQVASGPWVPFEVTAFVDDPAAGVRRWTWRVARIPATGHRVEDRPGGCRVVFEVPLWAAGYVPVCRRALATIARTLEDEGGEEADERGS